MYVEPYKKKNDSKYENRNVCVIVVSSYFKRKKCLNEYLMQNMGLGTSIKLNLALQQININ